MRLHKLVAEDPCVRVEHHASLNETVLYGMGELHLRVMLERMSGALRRALQDAPAEHSVSRDDHASGATGHHRHKKQTGGAGQFGEVYLRVEPLRARPGLRVRRRSRRRRDSHRSSFPRSRRACGRCSTEGAIAGFPLQDLRVMRLRRQASRGGFEGSRVHRRRPARVPERLSRGRRRSCSSPSCASK